MANITAKQTFGLHLRQSIFVFGAILSAFGTTGVLAQQNSVEGKPAFEVASIRPHKQDGNGSSWASPTPTGFSARNVTVRRLISQAYDIHCPDQLSGLPEWAETESFDITAKVDEGSMPAFSRLPPLQQRDQAASMLQSLLEERLRLKIHHDVKVLPVYALIVAKGGPKLKESHKGINLYGMVTARGEIHITGGPIGARFVAGLSNELDRVVTDRTGLKGTYDIDLKWGSDDPQSLDSGASIFTALQEQLGLKLISGKEPVDVIVVDRVERPSDN